MTDKRDPSIPVDDPDQFTFAMPPEGKLYFGDANVVTDVVLKFASDVISSYDGYLRGESAANVAQAGIEAAIKQAADIFMGRDQDYAIAPWQGKKMRGRLLAVIEPMKGDDDPGDALFRHIALQCVKCAVSMSRGMSEDEAGPMLREILDGYIGLILGVVS